MTRMIKACPACGSGQIHRRREGVRYRCGSCGEVFTVPAEKDARIDLKRMKPPMYLKKQISNNQ